MSLLLFFRNHGTAGVPAPPVVAPTTAGVLDTLLDDALFSIVVGDDTQGWRDITDEAGSFVCSNVRPGGAGACSFTLPADIWSLGYNEVRPDSRLVARYDGEVFWDGIILTRSVAYRGE
jgi:hypothetical protein